ncbi:uncharacterized protein LOC125025708 [Penaeus chinensis]|uniref:uncharacterized protein LOC125025708 n=1 Tax=Penaeus chinensis TaxID=139456 RepID=UPI001FB5A90E|nr:uncharacterized protein LOC125025708 [Penaeus chinensis]XP_047469805.1 uncharacterized protein LOC125025708 [Penaeus chinensis]XP_047469806.1 uncharacterized protein LOC125025708 [Penaeus chinensis]
MGNPLDEESTNFLRVTVVLLKGGKKVLYKVYIWGCAKPLHVPLKEYLLSKGMTSRMYKTRFHSTQREIIEADPSGASYDITLLYQCIRTACNNVAVEDNEWTIPSDTLEYFIYQIKDQRNSLAHGATTDIDVQEMISKIEGLRLLFLKTLQLAGKRFNKDHEVTFVENELNKMINRIRDESDRFTKALAAQRKQLREILVTEGGKELREHYNFYTEVDPSSFLWKKKKPKVTSVFTKLELVQESADSIREEPRLENLLKIKKHGEIPQVILLEGVAGSGKSTVTSLLIADWCSKGGKISGLQDFELLLHIQCRNPHVSSFLGVLLFLFQKTSGRMKEDDLIRSVLMSKVFFVIDGLDEANNASQKLLREILQMHIKEKNHNIRLICTTRPQSVEQFLRLLPEETSVIHLKIVGIPVEEQSKFIARYHEQLKCGENSQQDIKELLSYIQSTSQISEHFRLPLNLVFLTYLWMFSAKSFSQLYSATNLYMEILQLTKKKLIARLQSHLHYLDPEEIRIKCENFLEVMYQESLLALCQNSVLLSTVGTEVLKNKCKSLRLPSTEVLSGFFTFAKTWTGKSYREEFSFPHKGLQDFYAALAIIASITQKEDKDLLENVRSGIIKVLAKNNISSKISSEIVSATESILIASSSKPKHILSILEDLHRDDPSPLQINKYQNVLFHLVGLLKNDGENTLQKHAEELIGLLNKSGVKDSEQWLDILAEVDCAPVMMEEVVKFMPTHRWSVRDGHLKSALMLFPKVPVRQVDFLIEKNPYSVPYLKEMLQQVASTNCEIQLNLHYHWQHPEAESSDEILEYIKPLQSQSGCRLIKFMGSLDNLSQLSPHKKLEQVYIAFGKSFAESAVGSQDVLKTLRNMDYLYINILAGLPIEKLPILPETRFPIDLWLTHVDDSHEEWIKAVASKFKLSTQVWSIRFPRSNLTEKGCVYLFGALKDMNIGKDGVWVSSPHITTESAEKLKQIFLKLVKTPFRRVDDVSIWSF